MLFLTGWAGCSCLSKCCNGETGARHACICSGKQASKLIVLDKKRALLPSGLYIRIVGKAKALIVGKANGISIADTEFCILFVLCFVMV